MSELFCRFLGLFVFNFKFSCLNFKFSFCNFVFQFLVLSLFGIDGDLRVDVISFQEWAVRRFHLLVTLQLSTLHNLNLQLWVVLLFSLDLTGRLHNIKAANDPTEASADAIERRGPRYHDVEPRVDFVRLCGMS